MLMFILLWRRIAYKTSYCFEFLLSQHMHLSDDLLFLPLRTDGGVIAGAIIAAVVIFVLIVGLLYYVFSVRGYKLSGLRLPTRTTSRVDVVSYRWARKV